MRKLFKTTALAFIGMLTMASCANEEIMDVTSRIKSQEMDTTPSKEIFKFKYQGVQYAAEYEVVDSTMIFTDPEISDIVCNLESDPLVATLTYPDGMVEYFDSNKDFEEKIEAGEISYESINTRAASYTCLLSLTLKVYEHSDFRGKVLTFNGPISIPNMANVYNDPIVMKGTDFNDIISSFQLIGGGATQAPPPYIKIHLKAVVTFYEDANYAYGSASFLIDRDHPQISHSNFQKVKRCSYCKYNMNDRTSSIKLYWLE